MSSSVRRASAASLLILSLGLGATIQMSPASASPAGASASPAPASSPGAAQVGAGWIGRQFSPGGYIITAGVADPSSTVQAVLAFAASGVGGRKAAAAIKWLKKHFQTYVSPGGVDEPGALAYVILAAQAMGENPKAFGGTSTVNDLVKRLLDTQRTTGPDAGLFGSEDPTYDGAFRQGLSLMALANQGTANPAGVTWLQNQQCGDGGWEAYRSNLGTPCPRPDPDTFTGPDTNSTALATEGLVAQKAVHAGENADITSFFESAQNPDGGFGLIGTSSQSPDPDSTGEVIQALVALGQLTNAAFTQTGGTPVTALGTFQLGCSAKASHRGAYVFPGGKGPNMVATLQAVPGAAEVAFPLKAQTLQPGLPKMTCPAS